MTAAARHGTTFSSGLLYLGRCAWARTSRTSAHARQKKRKVLRPQAGQVPRRKQRRPPRALWPRRKPRVRRHQLLPRLQQRPQRHLLLLHRNRQPAPVRRVLHLRNLPRQQPLLPELQPLHQVRQLRGLSKRRDCRQCIPLPGITCIFIRRAVSILIRT